MTIEVYDLSACMHARIRSAGTDHTHRMICHEGESPFYGLLDRAGAILNLPTTETGTIIFHTGGKPARLRKGIDWVGHRSMLVYNQICVCLCKRCQSLRYRGSRRLGEAGYVIRCIHIEGTQNALRQRPPSPSAPNILREYRRKAPGHAITDRMTRLHTSGFASWLTRISVGARLLCGVCRCCAILPRTVHRTGCVRVQ